MTATQVLTEAEAKGVILGVRGGNITYKARPGVMTPDLINALKACKYNLIMMLIEPRCLIGPCRHVTLKPDDVFSRWWCSVSDQGVFDLDKCPRGMWFQHTPKSN